MSKEAFVYLWRNKISGRKYIGYHKGTQSDGYISSTSNQNFWKDLELGELEREIIFEGSTNECLKYEQHYLKKIDLRSDEWYNNARGAEIIFTQEVKDKIRNHHLGGTSGMLGKKHSEETKKKQQLALLDRVFTQDHLLKLRKPNKNKGKKDSEEFRNQVRDRTSDKNIYSFLNVHTNENYIGTRLEFSKKYNIARHNIVGLVHKKTKILANTWILID
jgi:hypothetical protein